MMSLLYIMIFSCMMMLWEVSIYSLTIATILSLLNLNQMFVYCEMQFMVIENISSLMIMLSLFLCLTSLLCSSNIKVKFFVFLIMVLGLVLILAFSVNNFIFFFIFFEISLIPTLMLIITWGYQPERLQAGSYMMLYTVGASLPLLVFLIYVSFKVNSFYFYMFQCSYLNISSFWMIMSMMMAFLVKLPMYMYHLWLPKAHVEAPLAGSMILAGILLKLGGYGLYLMFKMFNVYFMTYELIFVISLSLWGGLLSAFMCLRQIDIKSFIAYSSIVHMSLIVVGVFSNSVWGLMSVKIIMFAHGFTSPLLFYLAYISYNKSGSRSLLYSNGMLKLYPILSVIWFLTLSVNMAAPPSLNLIGELLIIPNLWMLGFINIIIMMFLLLFSVIYNMYLYTSVNHGSLNKFSLPKLSIKSCEYFSNVIHMIPLLMIFKMTCFVI